MPMRRLLTAFALLFCAVPALAATPAPGFKVKLLDGAGTLDSRSLIGKKALLVRFQSSWCKVCGEEAPIIERIWTRYRPLGIEVLGVHVEDTEADARRFLKNVGATYPAGMDPRRQIANRFNAKGTPYTIVINKRGEIVARFAGRTGEARLVRALDPLVKQPPKHSPPARLQ